MENRSLFQRAEKGYRKRRDPDQKFSSGYKPFGILYDGHTLTWIYACRLEKTPNRRHAVQGRNHFAFSDVRRLVAKATMDDNFSILCPVPRNSVINSFVTTLLRIAA